MQISDKKVSRKFGNTKMIVRNGTITTIWNFATHVHKIAFVLFLRMIIIRAAWFQGAGRSNCRFKREA